jgi:hypothetical protein
MWEFGRNEHAANRVARRLAGVRLRLGTGYGPAARNAKSYVRAAKSRAQVAHQSQQEKQQSHEFQYVEKKTHTCLRDLLRPGDLQR